MKSEKTAKEVVAFARKRLRELPVEHPERRAISDDVADMAVELAAFLGVELAPERPELPEWFGEKEAEAIDEDGLLVMRVSDRFVQRYAVNAEGGRGAWEALREGHNRWLAAKRRVEQWRGSGIDNLTAVQLIDRLGEILRGEDRE